MLRCYLFGCQWQKVLNRDAMTCARCDTTMSALDVISYWRRTDLMAIAIVFAATGRRPPDRYWLRRGWPRTAPRRYRKDKS